MFLEVLEGSGNPGRRPRVPASDPLILAKWCQVRKCASFMVGSHRQHVIRKRKYNRGRRVLGKWILDGYCRTSRQCFLEECTGNKRDHHTLLRLIKKNVAPGTIILTDKWKAYNQLSRHGYTHLTVNHRTGFVDPLTGTHTNTCEGMWFHAKKHMLRGCGRTRTDSSALHLALSTFMWKKKLNLDSSDSSVRRLFNQEIPQLMSRVFG